MRVCSHFGFLGNSVQQRMIRNYRDPPEYKSIISQKLCCNNRCQVAVLEELA